MGVVWCQMIGIDEINNFGPTPPFTPKNNTKNKTAVLKVIQV